MVRQAARYVDASQWWQAGHSVALPEPNAASYRLSQTLQALDQAAPAEGFEVPLVTILALARRGAGSGNLPLSAGRE